MVSCVGAAPAAHGVSFSYPIVSLSRASRMGISGTRMKPYTADSSSTPNMHTGAATSSQWKWTVSWCSTGITCQ